MAYYYSHNNSIINNELDVVPQAAVLLEHERQQMAKIHSGPGGPDMGPRPPMSSMSSMSSMPPGTMRGVCVWNLFKCYCEVCMIGVLIHLFCCVG